MTPLQGNNKKHTQYIAYMGMFTTLALAASYLESLFPIGVGIPGIKLGLANGVVMFLLYKKGWKAAAVVSVLRIFAAGFLFGSLFSIVYSLAGACCSLVGMSICRKKEWFSSVGTSIIGGVLHNLAQVLVAMVLLENEKILFYFPVLLISGVITGILIGVVTGLLLEKTKEMEHFL